MFAGFCGWKGRNELSIESILFVGNYPNPVDIYRNVFFQNLIFAIADKGVKCTVIAPVSYTHYRSKILKIPRLAQDTTSAGNSVDVFYPRCITYSSKKIFGRFNTGRLSEYSFQHAAVRKAKKQGIQFDCTYGHFFLEGGLAAVAIGRSFNKPSFIAFGECDFDSQVRHDYGEITNIEVKGLSGIISVSTDNCNELKTMPVFDSFPVFLAPNGADKTLFHPMNQEACRKRLGIRRDVFLVGFVGGFIERKGASRVLSAINQTDEVYGAFAGRGDAPSGTKVAFCKALKHEEIPVFLNACDVFALPTTSEGSCNAIIEAMACGLPIISSRLPFNEDILNDKNAVLIDPMNVEELKDAIIKLKSNQLFRRKIAANALADSENFTLQRRAIRILEFINTTSANTYVGEK